MAEKLSSELKAKIAQRQYANRAIVLLLSSFVEAMPEQRFHQLLKNLDILTPEPLDPLAIRNEWNLESVDLLERIKQSSLLNPK